jgi:DNA repair protein RecO (recombination protein O)
MNSSSDTGLVLHTIAWRETSLIIEVFTREHGRLGLIARGARRPRSALRGLLQPFQPIEVRWSGKSELRNLIAAEQRIAASQSTLTFLQQQIDAFNSDR